MSRNVKIETHITINDTLWSSEREQSNTITSKVTRAFGILQGIFYSTWIFLSRFTFIGGSETWRVIHCEISMDYLSPISKLVAFTFFLYIIDSNSSNSSIMMQHVCKGSFITTWEIDLNKDIYLEAFDMLWAVLWFLLISFLGQSGRLMVNADFHGEEG